MGKLGKVSWIVPRRANAEKVSGVVREDISIEPAILLVMI